MPRRNAGAAGDSTPPPQDPAAGGGGGAPTRRKRPPIRTTTTIAREEAAGKVTQQPVSVEQDAPPAVEEAQRQVAPVAPAPKKPSRKPKEAVAPEQPVEPQDSADLPDQGSESPTVAPDGESQPSHTPTKAVGKRKIKAPVRPKKDGRGPKPTYDWDTGFREFTEGILRSGSSSDEDRWFPTLRELADRHGYNYVTLRERASKERWTERKGAYQLEVTRERQKKRAQKMAKSAIEYDEKALKLGELGTNLIMARLGEIATELAARKDARDEAMERLKQGIPVDREDLHSAIYSREMESLASAAERFQNIAMRAIGTDVQKYSITGADGEALGGSTVVNITQEITRDDPERVAQLIKSFGDAGLLPTEVKDALYALEGVIDGEVVEDEPTQIEGTMGIDTEAEDDDMTPEAVKDGEEA